MHRLLFYRVCCSEHEMREVDFVGSKTLCRSQTNVVIDYLGYNLNFNVNLLYYSNEKHVRIAHRAQIADHHRRKRIRDLPRVTQAQVFRQHVQHIHRLYSLKSVVSIKSVTPGRTGIFRRVAK